MSADNTSPCAPEHTQFVRSLYTTAIADASCAAKESSYALPESHT